MRRGWTLWLTCLLVLWIAARVRAQEQGHEQGHEQGQEQEQEHELPPVPPPPPDPEAPPIQRAPTGAEALTPPPPRSYHGPRPWQRDPAYPSPPPHGSAPEVMDDDRRASGEMVELYLAGGGYGLLTGVWAASLFGDLEDSGSSAVPLLLGAGGALSVLAADHMSGGFRTGIPASIGMGAFIGLSEGLLMLAAFEPDSDASALTLVWGATTVGGAAGALVGSWLRPSIGDSRLVASAGVWGAYFAALTTIVAETTAEGRGRWALGGLNAGVALGLLLTPSIDLNGGQVMMLHAGVGAGALAGLIAVTIASRESTGIDSRTAAVTIGLGSLLGLGGMYLLVRPSDDGSELEEATALAPFAAPLDEGAVVGLTGIL